MIHVEKFEMETALFYITDSVNDRLTQNMLIIKETINL